MGKTERAIREVAMLYDFYLKTRLLKGKGPPRDLLRVWRRNKGSECHAQDRRRAGRSSSRQRRVSSTEVDTNALS